MMEPTLTHDSGTADESPSTGTTLATPFNGTTIRKRCITLFGLAPRQGLPLLLALAVGAVIWNSAPPEPLDPSGMHFLGTLAAAVIMWMFGVFDEYIVALLLLLSWLVLGIAPSDLALAGFSKSSWFFILGALGMAAAVRDSGLISRVVTSILRRTPPNFRLYSLCLTGAGWFITPSLPQVTARLVVALPLTQTISERLGLQPRSNGSAGLAFSSYVGCSQLTFTFLTGATTCFVAWSLLPNWAKSDFDWGTWMLAALPAGIVFVLLLNAFILCFFRLSEEEKQQISKNAMASQTEEAGPMNQAQWLCVIVVTLAPLFWISKPLHGISEAWVALAGLVVFLLTGVLNKKTIKSNIDWGFLLFFGVIYAIPGLANHLRIDKWLMNLVGPMFIGVSEPTIFLITVLLVVYFVRFFLGKTPTVIVLGLSLMALGDQVGIHPGVLMLTMLMAVETWVFPYQTPSYMLAYQGTDGKAFSHAQGRKLMAAKFLISFLAVAISVPYWGWLGFIEDTTVHTAQRSVGVTALAHASQRESAKAASKATPPLEPKPENRVASIQRILTELGFNPGPSDGVLGPRTISAIKKYQKHSGLEVNGRPSRTVVRYLQYHQSLHPDSSASTQSASTGDGHTIR